MQTISKTNANRRQTERKPYTNREAERQNGKKQIQTNHKSERQTESDLRKPTAHPWKTTIQKGKPKANRRQSGLQAVASVKTLPVCGTLHAWWGPVQFMRSCCRCRRTLLFLCGPEKLPQGLPEVSGISRPLRDLRFAQVASILSIMPVAAVMPVAVVMPALPRVVLPRWLSVAGADEDAPDIGLVSSPTLQPGVYRRVVAGTLQMYICLGSVEHFIQEVTHLPAGPYQPLAMQVAVLHEFPVNEVVVSNGTRPLWSDDVVICPFHDELRVLVTVSSAGVGERPTELPTQPPQIIPGGGGHRASDANSTSTSCAAASHIMVSGDEVTSKRRRRD